MQSKKLHLYEIQWYPSGFDCRTSYVLDYDEASAINQLIRKRCSMWLNYRIETIDEIPMDTPNILGHSFC